jgi:hypothetical protein
VATPTNQFKQTKRQRKDRQPTPRGFSDVRQNGDSTGEGTVSNNIGLSFVYLTCLSFCSFVLFYFCFIHAFLELFHASLVFIFVNTQAFRLGGELAICPMTIGQGSDA